MELLPHTELGRYNGGTESAYTAGDGDAFFNWYISGGYEYGGSAIWYFTSGGASSSTGSSNTKYWLWRSNNWAWMGDGTPDENAPRYSSDLPEVVNGNNQSFQNPYMM